MPTKIEISYRTIIFTVFFLLILQVLWIIREVIFAIFLSFIFMSALKPLVDKMEEKRIPRSIAAFGVTITTLLSLFFALAFIMPPIIGESLTFLKNLPFLIADAFPMLSIYFAPESVLRLIPNLPENIVKIAGGVVSDLIFIVSIIFFTFYFLLEVQFLKRFLAKFFDDSLVERILTVSSRIEKRMGAWLWGEVVLMTVIGAMTYIGLSLLGVRYALSLAFLAGLLEVVPIVGPTISAIPAIFVASSTSFFLGGSTLLLYFIIQQFENNIIVPVVMKKAVGINPITTLLALTIGGKLAGFMGIILSVPAALLIETVLSEILSKKNK